jgi:hypothetical protein
MSVAAATIIPISMAIFGIGLPRDSSVGYFNGPDSIIEDATGDAEAVLQRFNASIVPEVKDYHDIVGAEVRRADSGFILTINLAGNPNLNEKYETNYMWNLISSEFLAGTEHYYVVMFVNFAPDFNHTSQGWHYAIFDRTADTYIVPQTKIGDMPTDRVEFNLGADLIGNPSSFRYWISVFSRVDSKSFDGEPEYLMDYAP